MVYLARKRNNAMNYSNLLRLGLLLDCLVTLNTKLESIHVLVFLLSFPLFFLRNQQVKKFKEQFYICAKANH